MPTEQTEQFANNWAYLRTELNWLERMLMLAVARQRKETKELDRLAQSRADRATSHWWKGIIAPETGILEETCRKPTTAIAKVTYQQQLEQRIQASQQQGIALGLPTLCDRLGLTAFEKNLVLISIAPEVNRRYTRLYRYLQGDEQGVKTDLPTVDLVLRLLCRNDPEWRAARTCLTTTSPLRHHHLITLISQPASTLLSASIKLADGLIDYLLADHPTPHALDRLLQGSIQLGLPITQSIPTVDWADLVLPDSLLQSLQHLSQRLTLTDQVAQWGFESASPGVMPSPGTVVLLAGTAGTGKTMAAGAIAHSLQWPLHQVDLAQVDPTATTALLKELTRLMPSLLLIKSAQVWLNRSTPLAAAQLHQFLAHRHSLPSLTLLSVAHAESVALRWRSHLDQQLLFPKPKACDRLRLWKQAFPPPAPLAPDLDWNLLAQQLPLSGGEIRAIAREAAFHAAAEPAPIHLSHLIQALIQQKKFAKQVAKLTPKQQPSLGERDAAP